LICIIAQADVLEFPLPGMTGNVDFDTYQDSLLYAGDTLYVSAVKLVLHAKIEDLGTQICPAAPPLPSEVCTLGFHYYRRGG